jgi:hypothetical protein
MSKTARPSVRGKNQQTREALFSEQGYSDFAHRGNHESGLKGIQSDRLELHLVF